MENKRDVKPAAEGSNTVVHVVVRLVDGGRIVAGTGSDVEEAERLAVELVDRFAHPDTGWPLVEGRYVRPGAVVSIDLVTEEQRRWAGSPDRARIADSSTSAA